MARLGCVNTVLVDNEGLLPPAMVGVTVVGSVTVLEDTDALMVPPARVVVGITAVGGSRYDEDYKMYCIPMDVYTIYLIQMRWHGLVELLW